MLFYYVPTITSEKKETTLDGRTIVKTAFHVDIYEATKEDGNELIGTASLVLSTLGDDSECVDYIRVVSKYERFTGTSSVYSHLTLEELWAEHNKIVEECKELKQVWG